MHKLVVPTMLWLTFLVTLILPNLAFAQDHCGNIAQNIGCGRPSNGPMPPEVQSAICDNATTAAKQSCANGDCSATTSIAGYGDLDNKIKSMTANDLTSDPSGLQFFQSNNADLLSRYSPDCTKGLDASSDTTGGDHSGDGVTGTGKTLAKASNSAMQNQAKAAGFCQARYEMCQCESGRTKLNILQNSNLTIDAKNSITNSVDQAFNCGALNYSVAQGQAIKSFGTKDGSEKVAEKGGDKPGDNQDGSGKKESDPSGNSDDPAKDKKDKKSMGDLTSALGKVLEAALAPPQQPPPTNTQPPDMSQGSCGPNMVGGTGCPPPTAPAAAALPKGTGAFDPAASKNTQFNPGGSGPAVPPGTNIPPVDSQNPNQQPIGAAQVANNNGGAIPGQQGGGGSGGATLGGAAMAAAAAAKSNADIMRGFQGAGGGSSLAAQNAAMSMAAGGTGGWGSYGKGDEPTLNLADWLPGGSKRTLASLAAGKMAGPMPQILSKEVNIWSRVSEHFKSRCAQGLLRDCYP
jgi:hypothetical protein